MDLLVFMMTSKIILSKLEVAVLIALLGALSWSSYGYGEANEYLKH